MSTCTICTATVFATLAVFVVVFNGERAVVTPSDSLRLGDLNYVYPAVKAPTATGTFLRVQSWLLTESPISPFLRRVLVNNNNIVNLRQLAIQTDLPPLHFPIARLNAKDYQEHAEATPTAATLLANGLPSSPETSDSKVMAMHRAFLSGSTTPEEVAKRLIKAVEKLQPKYKMFSSFLPEDVMEQARASTARYKANKPLSVFDGVPVGMKDMTPVRGHVTTYGSAAHVSLLASPRV